MTSRQLTLFAGATRASPSPLPGSEGARRMTATSGRKCVGSWTSSGPLGCLERMLLGTSAWASTTCFLTWKPSATPAGRLLFRLVPSMPGTDEIGCGLWPTAKGSPSGPDFARASREGSGGHDLATAVALWPTPNAADGKSARNSTANRKSIPPTGVHAGHTLMDAVTLWPTRQAKDWRSGKVSYETLARNSRPLNEIVTLYPTPDAGAAKGRGVSSASTRSRLGGSLNPTWVEWLMGYPAGWTDLRPSATPSSRRSSR